MLTQPQLDHFRDQGYLVVEGVLTTAEIEVLKEAVARLEQEGDRQDLSLKWSKENLTTILDLPVRAGSLSRLLQYRPVLSLVEQLAGAPLRVAGGLLLDKDPENNWEIGWHQDTGICVAAIPPGKPEDIRGGRPFYRTKGLELARDVACRIALDPATAESGGLYLLPGSHRANLGSGDHVKQRFAAEQGIPAQQAPGSALCYCPLTLHRSEKMALPGRRRILHLRYSLADLKLPGAVPYPWPQPCPVTPLDSLA